MQKKVKFEFNGDDWAMLEEVARVTEAKPKNVIRALFMEIRDALTKSNTTVKLPAAWALAFRNLEQATIDDVLTRDGAEIDLRLLQTNPKLASGFAGVYPHPNPARGWMAQGKDPATKQAGKYLGTFTTAVQAAWARYQHYRKCDMPYGKLEEAMEKFANDPVWRGLPEHWIKALAIHMLATRGTILPDLTPAERKWETNSPVNEIDC